jgi:hypothetical protein
MIRMLILGYAFGLRSERLLCRDVNSDIAGCSFDYFVGKSEQLGWNAQCLRGEGSTR